MDEVRSKGVELLEKVLVVFATGLGERDEIRGDGVLLVLLATALIPSSMGLLVRVLSADFLSDGVLD